VISSTEILLIGAVALVLFGSSKLPKFFRALGKAKSEFKKGVEEGKNQED